MKNKKGIAKHIILELWDAKNTNSASTIKQALSEACKVGKLNLDKLYVHRFSPFGISGVALIAKAHITIHTWPEYGYAAADVFTCGDRANAETACAHLLSAFQAGRHSLTKLTRGAEAVRPIAEPPLVAAIERPTPNCADWTWIHLS